MKTFISQKAKGFFFAALAAAFYGTNPIFAIPLYKYGMNPVSVLLFRYVLGVPLLAAVIIFASRKLALHSREVLPVALLGVMMGISSLALYEAYRYMSAGIASTLLFMYPVLTSLLMMIFFHEKFRLSTAFCLFLMGVGLYLLSNGDPDAGFSLTGFILIFISSITYAIYLVMIKVSRTLRQIPTIRSLLYQLLFGSLVFAVALFMGNELVLPHTFFEWSNLAALAIIPTVLSLLFTIKAIGHIGPTPTAIFGALEPITAVALGIIILGETITTKEIIGGVLIISATMIVVLADKKA